MREHLLPVFEISSQICSWLNLTLMLLCGYGFWMFFLLEAVTPTCIRSAEDLLREKTTAYRRSQNRGGSVFWQNPSGSISVIVGRKRLGNLRNIAAQNRAITHKNSRKQEKYSSVVIFLSLLPSVLSP